jgi:hypothetical protein
MQGSWGKWQKVTGNASTEAPYVERCKSTQLDNNGTICHFGSSVHFCLRKTYLTTLPSPPDFLNVCTEKAQITNDMI